MTTSQPPRSRRLARHALAVFAAGTMIAALNFTGIGSGTPGVSSANVHERSASPSRSVPDRLSIQPQITVGELEGDFLQLATASADGANSDACIASPLEPGIFRMSSAYGIRTNPITRTRGLHAGVDLAAAMGTPIHAVADGVVSYTGAGKAGRSSEIIIIDHEVDGVKFSSWYVHMYRHGVFVTAGQKVRAGEKIAAVGSNGFSTGPHLHLEIHTPVGYSGGLGKSPSRLIPGALPYLLGLEGDDAAGIGPTPQETPSTGSTPEPTEDATENPTEDPTTPEEPPDGEENPDDSTPTDPPAEGETTSPEGESPNPDDSGVEEEPTPGSPSDFEIEEDDDHGENDHVIEKIIEDNSGDRSTGIFDPSSLGVLHDPIPFLRALGYGLVAPSSCLITE